MQGAADGGSAVAQVARARLRELRWLGRGKNDVKVKGPSPPLFIKLVGSRRATGLISL